MNVSRETSLQPYLREMARLMAGAMTGVAAICDHRYDDDRITPQMMLWTGCYSAMMGYYCVKVGYHLRQAGVSE